MGFFAHAQTVSTRPLFPPPTWPGYEAKEIRYSTSLCIFTAVYAFPHADGSRRNDVNWQLAHPYLKQHNYSSAASTTLSSQPSVDENEGAQLPVLDSLLHSELPAPN